MSGNHPFCLFCVFFPSYFVFCVLFVCNSRRFPVGFSSGCLIYCPTFASVAEGLEPVTSRELPQSKSISRRKDQLFGA